MLIAHFKSNRVPFDNLKTKGFLLPMLTTVTSTGSQKHIQVSRVQVSFLSHPVSYPIISHPININNSLIYTFFMHLRSCSPVTENGEQKNFDEFSQNEWYTGA